MRGTIRNLLGKPQLVFLIIAGTFCILSAVLMPILEVPDENRDFQIAYAIFSSHKHAANDSVLSRDLVLNEDLVLRQIRNNNYRQYFLHKTSAKDDGIAINTGSYVFDGKTKASAFNVMYLPQAIGILLGRLIYPSLGVMVVFGRLATVALYLAAMYWIIKKVRYGKWALAFIASLPIVIQQAASLSHDSVNLLAVFCWFAFIINLFARSKTAITWKDLAGGAVLAVFLLLTKANNVLLLALVVGLPATYLTQINLYRRLRESSLWRPVKYLSVPVAAAVACAVVLVIFKVLLAGHPFHPHRLVDVLANTFIRGDKGDLTLIDATVTGMVGEFSNFYYHLPVWIVGVAFMVLLVIMLYEKLPNISRRFAALSGSLFFVSILLITIGMYYAWAMLPIRLGPNAAVADGIQGRYFTPLLVLLFPMFAYLQRYVKITAAKETTVPLVASVTSTFLLIIYIYQTWFFFWR